MTDNPFRSPSANDPSPTTRRKPRHPRLKPVVWSMLIGAVIVGQWLIAPHVRGPGDPSGRFIGAGLGGFLGLATGLTVRLLSRRTP